LTVSLPPQPTWANFGLSTLAEVSAKGFGLPLVAAQVDQMTTQPQSSGDGAGNWPRTGSTASDAEGDATASYRCSPRKFGQAPQLTVSDNFDEPLTDAQIAPRKFRVDSTH
jgi:hypothetical protein